MCKTMLEIIIIIIIIIIHKAVTIQGHGGKLIIQMVCDFNIFAFHNTNLNFFFFFTFC